MFDKRGSATDKKERKKTGETIDKRKARYWYHARLRGVGHHCGSAVTIDFGLTGIKL